MAIGLILHESLLLTVEQVRVWEEEVEIPTYGVAVHCFADGEGGSEAYIAQARTRDGSQAILKVAIPENNGGTVLANEITALTVADGHGYVRLLRSDLSRRALLLERLGIPFWFTATPTTGTRSRTSPRTPRRNLRSN